LWLVVGDGNNRLGMAAMCVSLERALLAEKYGDIVAESMKLPPPTSKIATIDGVNVDSTTTAAPYLNTYGTAT
jgi:hypothetical protein